MASFSDKGEPSGCSTDEPDPPRETQSQKSLLTLIQPTSAAAERVFSLLSNSFGSAQERSLEDYIEASIMLQYNHH